MACDRLQNVILILRRDSGVRAFGYQQLSQLDDWTSGGVALIFHGIQLWSLSKTQGYTDVVP